MAGVLSQIYGRSWTLSHGIKLFLYCTEYLHLCQTVLWIFLLIMKVKLLYEKIAFLFATGVARASAPVVHGQAVWVFFCVTKGTPCRGSF